jgi:hypothetical protein
MYLKDRAPAKPYPERQAYCPKRPDNLEPILHELFSLHVSRTATSGEPFPSEILAQRIQGMSMWSK